MGTVNKAPSEMRRAATGIQGGLLIRMNEGRGCEEKDGGGDAGKNIHGEGHGATS